MVSIQILQTRLQYNYVNNDEHRHEIHKFSLAIKIKLGESI